jgi:hypothetical protein
MVYRSWDRMNADTHEAYLSKAEAYLEDIENL